MGGMEWVFAAFKRTFEIRGRSRRKEYWLYTLFIIVMTIILLVVDSAFELYIDEDTGMLSTLFLLATFITSFTVTIRRFHDIGKSGWWILLNFIPFIGTIVIFVFTVLNSEAKTNAYGEDPKMGGLL